MSPGSVTILVVDDNQINLKLASTVLRAEGYSVATAADAETALDLVAALSPRLVFTDVQLPEMDGLELTRRLKADWRTAGVVVVALTACAMEADRVAAFAAGCDGFIAKPIDTRTIGAQVADFLRDRRPTTAA